MTYRHEIFPLFLNLNDFLKELDKLKDLILSKIGKLKRWPTLTLIICVLVVVSISIYAFISSNNVKAMSNQDNPKIETNNITKQENNTGVEDLSSSAEKATSDSVNSIPVVSSVEPQTSNSQPVSTDYKKFFKDDAFLGDSISEGLSFYDFLDDNRVIAEKGLSITKGIDEADKIIALKPSRVFILFGVNDIDDRTRISWIVDQYTTLVVKLKTKLPNSKIYVTSILPVLENLVNNTHINNAHIQACNIALMHMAGQQNVNYINLASLLNDTNKDLYEGDGIHFKSDFYIMWLNYLESISK